MGVVIEVAGEISFLARGKLSAQSRDWRAASRSLDLSGKSVRRMNALCLFHRIDWHVGNSWRASPCAPDQAQPVRLMARVWR
jgi:hypothetical protein